MALSYYKQFHRIRNQYIMIVNNIKFFTGL